MKSINGGFSSRHAFVSGKANANEAPNDGWNATTEIMPMMSMTQAMPTFGT